MKFGIIKKVPGIIGSKIKNRVKKDMQKGSDKKNNFLLEEYNKGKILSVDSGVDNKELIKSDDPKKYFEENKQNKKSIQEENTKKSNHNLVEEISKLIKEKPGLKVKTYLRELLRKHKGNLDQEETTRLIKEEIKNNGKGN